MDKFSTALNSDGKNHYDTTIEFKEDGTFVMPDMIHGEINGNWEKISDNHYRLTFNKHHTTILGSTITIDVTPYWAGKDPIAIMDVDKLTIGSYEFEYIRS